MICLKKLGTLNVKKLALFVTYVLETKLGWCDLKTYAVGWESECSAASWHLLSEWTINVGNRQKAMKGKIYFEVLDIHWFDNKWVIDMLLEDTYNPKS